MRRLIRMFAWVSFAIKIPFRLLGYFFLIEKRHNWIFAVQSNTFFIMVLPMSKSVVATVSVFTFLNVWNDYLWPSLVFTSSDLLTAQIGLNAITSNENTTMGQTLAVITLVTIPVIIIYALFSKQIVEAVVSTGSKEG